MRVKTAPVVSTLDGLNEVADVEVASGSLVVAGSTDRDVELAESAVNPGLWGGFACLRVEEEHVLHWYESGGTPGSTK